MLDQHENLDGLCLSQQTLEYLIISQHADSRRPEAQGAGARTVGADSAAKVARLVKSKRTRFRYTWSIRHPGVVDTSHVFPGHGAVVRWK